MRVRDVFFDELYYSVKSGEDIVIVSSDLGAPSLDKFRRDFPQRFINVGIAEQNAIAVAGGLQTAGKKVIVYGLNPFPVTRAFDQVRNILSYLNLPVTVCALNAGSCSAEAGYTHMAIENVSIMRTLRNVDIINPTDETIARKLVDEILNNPKPRYIQFDKFLDGKMYKDEDISFLRGYVLTGNKNSSLAIVGYGITAKMIKEVRDDSRCFDFYNMTFDEQLFLNDLCGVGKIVTVEDGVLPGGLGSMILEFVSKHDLDIKVERYGLDGRNNMTKYLNRDCMFSNQGITAEMLKKL